MRKAIKITSQLKTDNPIFFKKFSIDDYIATSVPSTFNRGGDIIEDYDTREDLQELDGWKNIVVPNLDFNNERQGQIIDNPSDSGITATYSVVPLTTEEVKNRQLRSIEKEKEKLIEEKLIENIITEAQNTTDEEALNQKELYPFWSGDSVTYSLGFKVLDFTADNELALYKVVQAHISQSNWQPINVPALFTRIQLDVVLI